ncbi:MAG: hypothetical protein AAGC46_05050 [Solirubrobacteraceae bacterium]|nr:hypothetical protein [Patulibacter sp.]
MPTRSPTPDPSPAIDAPAHAADTTRWLRREPFPARFVALWLGFIAVWLAFTTAFALFAGDSGSRAAAWAMVAFGVVFGLLGPGMSRGVAVGVDQAQRRIRVRRGRSGLLAPPVDRAAPFSAITDLEAVQSAPSLTVGRLDPDEFSSGMFTDTTTRSPWSRSWSRVFGVSASMSPASVDGFGTGSTPWQLVATLATEPLGPATFDGLQEIRPAATWPDSPIAFAGAADETEARALLAEYAALFGVPADHVRVTRLDGTTHRVS